MFRDSWQSATGSDAHPPHPFRLPRDTTISAAHPSWRAFLRAIRGVTTRRIANTGVPS